jgi:hypothetical protein
MDSCWPVEPQPPIATERNKLIILSAKLISGNLLNFFKNKETNMPLPAHVGQKRITYGKQDLYYKSSFEVATHFRDAKIWPNNLQIIIYFTNIFSMLNLQYLGNYLLINRIVLYSCLKMKK